MLFKQGKQTIEEKRKYNRERFYSKREELNAKNNKWYHTKFKQDMIKTPSKYLYQAAKKRAKRKNIEFNITIEDIIVPDLCPVFNIPLIIFSDSDNSPTLDRIDNTRGYVKGNVKVISELANRIKSNANLAQIKAIAAYMERENNVV